MRKRSRCWKMVRRVQLVPSWHPPQKAYTQPRWDLCYLNSEVMRIRLLLSLMTAKVRRKAGLNGMLTWLWCFRISLSLPLALPLSLPPTSFSLSMLLSECNHTIGQRTSRKNPPVFILISFLVWDRIILFVMTYAMWANFLSQLPYYYYCREPGDDGHTLPFTAFCRFWESKRKSSKLHDK